MNTRELIKKSGIELQSSGFSTYSEFVTLEEFEKLCNHTREDERTAVLSHILDVFQLMVKKASHNPEQRYTWKVAINLIETEFSDNDE